MSATSAACAAAIALAASVVPELPSELANAPLVARRQIRRLLVFDHFVRRPRTIEKVL